MPPAKQMSPKWKEPASCRKPVGWDLIIEQLRTVDLVVRAWLRVQLFAILAGGRFFQIWFAVKIKSFDTPRSIFYLSRTPFYNYLFI